jgi:hypothetical protein
MNTKPEILAPKLLETFVAALKAWLPYFAISVFFSSLL